MTGLPRIRRALLSMLRPGEADAGLLELTGDDWLALDEIARLHRLQPLLHEEWPASGRGAFIPEAVQASWSAAHRQAALAALRQRADLLKAIGHLADSGIQAVALKGAWLAWYAYPRAAMRPLRDIDLLVGEAQAIAAWRSLRAAGFTAPDGEPEPRSDQRDKHFPHLVAPGGTPLELHMRSWEYEAHAGHRMPPLQDGQLFDASRCEPDGLRYFAPEDMLVHLIVHAVYSHWLDVGPLVLADIDFLLRRETPDWQRFWRRGEQQGWARGAALVIALTGRWRCRGLFDRSQCPIAVPPELLDSAPDLMLQSMELRAGTKMIARLRREGVGRLVAAKITEIRTDPSRFARLAGRRLRETASGAMDRGSREKSRQMHELGSWILDPA